MVAAGVLAYGVHDLQEAGILPGLTTSRSTSASTIPPTAWYGTLLKGVFNFSPATTWLEAIVWTAYLVPTMVLFVRMAWAGPPAARKTTATPVAVPASTALGARAS